MSEDLENCPPDKTGSYAGAKCDRCGSRDTYWESNGGYQEADASRHLPMMETSGMIGCAKCGNSWWD